MKKIFLVIVTFIGYQSYSQSIEKSSIDSGGGFTSNGNIELLYTIGEVNVQEFNTPELNLSEGFLSTNFRIQIEPKLFLQGPILNPTTAGLMNDDLRELNYLPTTSPYVDVKEALASVFNLGSTSGTGLPENDIVDWVWVEVRQSNDNTKVTRGQSALLQRDGDVVDVDGTSSIFMNAAPTNYYVVVKHRNHLGAMSSSTILLQEDSNTLVDFTDTNFLTYGNYARVDVGSGNLALWAGDTYNSNQIKFSGSGNSVNIIKDYVLADPSNGFGSVTYSSSGYLNIDVNLDGSGKFSGSENDSNIIKDNVLEHPENGFGSPTYTITTTIPSEN